ncbi:MAG: hypothetical protein NT034_04285 [Candidatus Magasanikbacteria bacterium]|nr:hypothetical protein [Candidatus Magasanikbacteria bacterium]
MLSSKAQKILNDYFNLPFEGLSGVRCPYFNNSRLKQRAQLRVLVGKGLPQDIIEEAKIISVQYHAGLFDKSGHCCLHNEHTGEKVTIDQIRKFLIDNNLGIECSGFVTQILRAHFLQTKEFDLVRNFHVVSPRHFLRYFISFLRPVENVGVKHYADDRNTNKISWDQAGCGDVVVMLETGSKNNINHILLITEKTNDTIKYAHARAWDSEGKYGHGVSLGEIRITNPKGSLLDQQWMEQAFEGEKNETFIEAKQAKTLQVRRIKF